MGFVNIRGWRSKEVEMGQVIKDQRFDVFGMAETFLRNEDEIKLEGYQWFGAGRSGGGKASGGVGLLVKETLQPRVRPVKDDKTMWVECNGGGRKVALGVVYSSPEGVRVEETKKLYNKLEEQVNELREEGKVVVVMGDFNCRIGAGRGGDEVVNTNGRRLLAWSTECDMVILNNGRKCTGKWTWSNADSRTTIDYMLIDKEDEHLVTRMTIDDEGLMDVGSDHCILELELEMEKCPDSTQKETRWKWKVDGKDDWEDYQTAVSGQMGGWEGWVMEAIESSTNHVETAETVWEEWKRRVTTAAEMGIGRKKVVAERSKSWWDDEIATAIEERREACRSLKSAQRLGKNKNLLEQAWERYKSKRREVKKIIRRKKEEDRERTLRFIAENGGAKCKRFWSDLNKRNKKKAGGIVEIKSESGEVLVEPDEVKERMREYWEKLGKGVETGTWDDPGEEPETMARSGNDDDISLEEIVYALRNLERGKAAGPDGLLNEMMMFGGEEMMKSLKVLFNALTQLEHYPQEWSRSLIVPVFKEGDKQELDNYRGIALSCTVGKVFERVVEGRIREVSEAQVMREAQGGFRKDRRGADQIFVLRSVMELRKKQGLDTVIAFLDVKKAYDTVWREGVWSKMRQYGITEKLVKWCEMFYERVEAAVVTGHGMTGWFEVETGLRQGSVLSPLLYSIFMMDLVEELEESGDGVIVSEAYCGMLMFADDMAMMAETEEEMARMLDRVAKYSEKWRFKFNERKSKVMVVAGRGRREKRRWWLGDKEMEETEDYKYLGVWVDAKLKGKVHLEKKIEAAEESK